MVCVLDSGAVDHSFESRSCQTKDYNIGVCCFFAKYAELRNKCKDWLAWNQNNVPEWSDVSTHRHGVVSLLAGIIKKKEK